MGNMGNKSIVTLGNFDGVHIGHQAVLKTASALALKENLKSITWTFSEHPKNVIAKTPLILPIMTNDIKREVILKNGIDEVVFADFSVVRDMSCNEFFEKILISELSCSHVVCGENYRFGKNEAGDITTLSKLCSEYRIKYTILPMMKSNMTGETVSSTKIRAYIKAGEIESANLLLSRPFLIRGKTVSGTRLGSKNGIPTLNQEIPKNICKPKNGVYFSCAIIDGIQYPSITNIGKRPTVDGFNENIETHVLGYYGNAYDKIVDIGFLKFHRDELLFKSIDELFTQIEKDIAERKIWKG